MHAMTASDTSCNVYFNTFRVIVEVGHVYKPAQRAANVVNDSVIYI